MFLDEFEKGVLYFTFRLFSLPHQPSTGWLGLKLELIKHFYEWWWLWSQWWCSGGILMGYQWQLHCAALFVSHSLDDSEHQTHCWTHVIAPIAVISAVHTMHPLVKGLYPFDLTHCSTPQHTSISNTCSLDSAQMTHRNHKTLQTFFFKTNDDFRTRHNSLYHQLSTISINWSMLTLCW